MSQSKISSRNLVVSGLLAIALLPSAASALRYPDADYAATYAWTFPDGNLISDWSFENESDELCATWSEGGFETNCHVFTTSAKSGSFVMSVHTSNAAGGVARGQMSDYLVCEPKTAYLLTFSIKTDWSDRSGSNFPILRFYKSDRSAGGQDAKGPPYEGVFSQSTQVWRRYSMAFTTGSEDAYLRLSLVESNSTSGNEGNYFLVDNVMIGKADGENSVTSSRAYGDASGRVDETVESDGATDLISFQEYDSQGRPFRTYLPAANAKSLPSDLTAIVVGKPQGITESLGYDFSNLQEAYAALRAYAGERLASDFTTTPVINVVGPSSSLKAPLGSNSGEFSRLKDKNQVPIPFKIEGIVKYSAAYYALASRHGTTGAPERQYTFKEFQAFQAQQYPGESRPFSETKPATAGGTLSSMLLPGGRYEGHPEETDWSLVSSTTGKDYTTGEAPYLYKCESDRANMLTESWVDAQGRVAKTGSAGKYTTFQYDGFGRIIGATTPMGSWSNKEWNGVGQVTATDDPDRNRWEYMYDTWGRQRFVHPPEPGMVHTTMLAHKYDNMGRMVESGQTAYVWDASAANNSGIYPPEWLDVGYFYDELNANSFSFKTGVNLSTIGLDPAKLTHTEGRLVASYNRNSETNAPGLTAANRKLVASFFAYDEQGRIAYVYRYIGQIENTADRLQKIQFVYDRNNRLESRIVYKNYSSDEVTSVPASVSDFVYDDLGRITDVIDKSGRIMASYGYSPIGALTGVDLYDKFHVGYQYDIRGQITKTDAYAVIPKEWVFSEELGYDTDADPNIPNPFPMPRWDGKISSSIRKFGKNVPNPVICNRYEYSGTGALATVWQNPVKSFKLLNDDGSINYQYMLTLDFNNQETERYVYDPDDNMKHKETETIAGVQDQTQTYDYFLSTPGHRVRDVRGSPRPSGERMTGDPSGNFWFDLRGNMYKDVGLGKEITYGYANDRPLTVSLPGVKFHSFYDEGFNRVAEIEESSGAVRGRHIYLAGPNTGVLKEYVWRSPTHPLHALDQTKNNLYGRGGIIGVEEEATGKKKLYLKDHLGSLVKVLDEETGGYLDDLELTYFAFGLPKAKVEPSREPSPTGTFTGQEYQDLMKTYFFGARSFDPLLAQWLSPDPVPGGMNPYAYAKDPISYVDPNGEIAIFVVVLAAALANVAIHYLNGDIHSSYDVGKAFVIGGFTSAVTSGLFLETGVVDAAGIVDYYDVDMTAAQVWGNAGLRVLGSRIPSLELADGVTVRPSFFIGTEGLGAGADFDMTIKTKYADLHTGLHATLNASELFSNKSGAELNPYYGATVKTGGKLGEFSFYHNDYFSGETSQSNNLFAYSNKYMAIRYQNDQDIGFSGGGDRWRTAAGDIQIKLPGDLTISVGTLLYTGAPLGYGKTFTGDPSVGKENDPETRYTMLDNLKKAFGGDPEGYKGLTYNAFDKWHSQKAGALYGGVSSGGTINMIGRNSEAVRDAFQNQLVHRNMHVPYMKPDPNMQPKPFLMYRTDHQNTLY
jgi:RHS repeat-associated protein